jgi:hypothetical protein
MAAIAEWTTDAPQSVRAAFGARCEEVPAFAPLLDGLDPQVTVVTTDALHTHPEAAEFLVGGKQAHDLLVVKANQPTLLDRCASLPWHQVPELDRTRDRAHGRVEIRTLKAVSVRHLGFPTPPRSSRSPQDPDACHPAVSSGAVSL